MLRKSKLHQSFIVYTKTDDFYKDVAEDVENRCDTSNYELNRPLPKGKNKKIIESMKLELGKKNNDIICGIKSKNLMLLHKWC